MRRKADIPKPRRVLNLPPLPDMTWPNSVVVIEGVMLWPGENDEDKEQRRRAIERSEVEYYKEKELNEIDKADLFARADAAYPLAALQPHAVKPYHHGMFAGIVLHTVLELIAGDPDNASLGRAIEMTLLAFPPGRQLSNATFNKTIWPKFRCVAHLWAAYFSLSMFHDRIHFPSTLDDLPTFLADAEGYRIIGKSWKTKQSPRKAILLADETIRLPEGLAIEPTDLRFEMEPARKL